MSDTDSLPPKTHNLPPVVLPKDEEMLADLRRKYAEIEPRLAEWEEALKGFPKELTLKDDDIAKNLQDLLGQIDKEKKRWVNSDKKAEKGPLNKLLKVVENFFSNAEEKADKMLAAWAPVHEAYTKRKITEARRLEEEELERQRQRAAEEKRKAEEAEARRKAAEEAEAAARQREEDARQRAAEEDARKKAAQEAAARAEAEEKRIAEERRVRERAEKELNADNLKKIKGHMKEAEKLNDTATATGDETPEAEIQQLDALVRPGGIVSLLVIPVRESALLTEEQRAEIEGVKTRVDELRKFIHDRSDAKERRKRNKLAKEEEERQATLAEERRIQREADEKRTAEAKERREKAEAEEAAAEAARKKAQGEVRDARSDASAAMGEQKAATVAGRQADAEGQRAQNRGDRIERRIDNTTDSERGKTRGDLGTQSSVIRYWVRYIQDEDALRKVCGPLGSFLTSDSLEGATHQFMRARQSGFVGERVELPELPGVVFAYEEDVKIKT